MYSTANTYQNTVATVHEDTMHAQTHTQTHMPIRSTVLALVAFAMLAAALYAPEPTQAQTLPYKAWGSGRVSGEVIRALKGSTQVGQVIVTGAGSWEINIFLGGEANVANGDRITFTVDGRAAAETVTYFSGLFSTPPGLVLMLPPAATPPLAPTPPPAAARGRLASTPVFDSTGRALAVYTGGTVNELATAATESRATGVWVQDASGAFHLYIVGGPAFLGDDFRAKFAAGFGVTSVLLVR